MRSFTNVWLVKNQQSRLLPRQSNGPGQGLQIPIGQLQVSCLWGQLVLARLNLPKALADYLFNTEQALIQFDMSEACSFPTHWASPRVCWVWGRWAVDRGCLLASVFCPSVWWDRKSSLRCVQHLPADFWWWVHHRFPREDSEIHQHCDHHDLKCWCPVYT